jgi:hypothetical protein
MNNNLQLHCSLGLVKQAEMFDYAPDVVKNYRPFNPDDAWKGGLATAGIGAGLGLGLGAVRKMFRPKEERKKNSDLLKGALMGATLGLPVAALPHLKEPIYDMQAKNNLSSDIFDYLMKSYAVHSKGPGSMHTRTLSELMP